MKSLIRELKIIARELEVRGGIPKEDEALLNEVDIKLLGNEFDRVTAGVSYALDIPVKKARDDAQNGKESARKVLIEDVKSGLVSRFPDKYRHLIRNLKRQHSK